MYHTCVSKMLTVGETGRGRGKMENSVLSALFSGKPKTTLKSKVY